MAPPSVTKLLSVTSLVPGENPWRGGKLNVDDIVGSLQRGTPILHNLVVRPISGTATYEVLCGHRRLEAARRHGLAKIECKIFDVDKETAAVFSLTENLKRRALRDEAGATAALLALFKRKLRGKTGHGGDRRSTHQDQKRQNGGLESAAEAVARETKQSVRDVQRKARIGRRASPKVLQALADDDITIADAERLVTLASKDEQDRGLVLLRDRKHRQAAIPPDLRRCLESLEYVSGVLAKKSPKDLPAPILHQLWERMQTLSAQLQSLGKAERGSRRVKLAVAARTGRQQAPMRGVADLAVSFEPASFNRKLGNLGFAPGKGSRPSFNPLPPYVAETKTSIEGTCPTDCAFRGAPGAPGGCFGEAGLNKVKGRKMDAAARGLSPEEVVAAEARAIDRAFGGGAVPDDGQGRPRGLRLHTIGDVGSEAGAKMLAGAAARWIKRAGARPWTYTHFWRQVPRSAFGAISVLASIESPRQAAQARRQGYAASLVVEEFPNGALAFQSEGVTYTPCPAETLQKNCAECRLCWDSTGLFKRRAGIAFAAHGPHRKQAVRALTDTQLKR